MTRLELRNLLPRVSTWIVMIPWTLLNVAFLPIDVVVISFMWLTFDDDPTHTAAHRWTPQRSSALKDFGRTRTWKFLSWLFPEV